MTTEQLRQAWGPPCKITPVHLLLWSGAKVEIEQRCQQAFRALDCVLQAYRYHVRSGDTGGQNCRPITGGTLHSLHSYGIAVDLNWNTNPYRADGRLVTDMPITMLGDIRKIRTRDKATVFRWGGDYIGIKDAMHFEILVTPAELARGIDWTTVRMPGMEAGRASTWPVVQKGDRGPHVVELQKHFAHLNPDGIAGDQTERAVREYQVMRGLKPDGTVGAQTWTALLHDMPEIGPLDPSPVKIPTRLRLEVPHTSLI
jgi:hypothetical protein